MAEEWLIDGYNLLHAWPAGKRSQKKSRETLLSELAGFAALKAQRMKVVLDGKGDESELKVHHTEFLHVVYSQKVSADAYLERELFERRGKAQFTVVTNDRAIANIARGSGERVWSTEVFLQILKESRSESSDIEHRNKSRSHGFNRPFDDKLKDR